MHYLCQLFPPGLTLKISVAATRLMLGTELEVLPAAEGPPPVLLLLPEVFGKSKRLSSGLDISADITGCHLSVITAATSTGQATWYLLTCTLFSSVSSK